MPATKNANERYRILDRCFSNFREEYTFDDLLRILDNEIFDRDECISVRQLRADIRYMREGPYHAPIETYPMYDGTKRRYYRYTDENYSINKHSSCSIGVVNKLNIWVTWNNTYNMSIMSMSSNISTIKISNYPFA